MGGFIDLTGQKFGKLTVIKKTDRPENRPKGSVYWLCKCECGNKIIVSRDCLKNGKTKSCGCLLSEKLNNRLIDLTGQKFGRLTVIRRVSVPDNVINKNQAYWLCECDCGNEKIVAGYELRRGRIVSCGCINEEKRDLSGNVFGRLTVIKKHHVKNNNGRILWLCKCICGNETLVDTATLKNGATQSCGCLRIEIISDTLKKYNNYNLLNDYGIGWTSNTNEEFYFDLEDYDKIKNYCWYKMDNGYLATNIEEENSRNIILIHRFILDIKHDEVDHKNHNKLDNRKENIRNCTRCQNSMNIGIRSNNTSGVTGVSWQKRDERWCARITANKKDINLGYFINFEDAVEARKEAEVKYFGEYRYKGLQEEI